MTDSTLSSSASVALQPLSTGRLALNAVCLYTAAFLVTTTLHELGHALTSALLGGSPVLYSTYVDSTTPNLPEKSELLIALAGPLVSLVQGLLLLLWARRRARSEAGALFILYMGVFGVINFFGYVMTGPFFSYGDLGQALHLLHTPGWLIWTLAVASAIGIHFLIARSGPLFLRLVPAAFIEEGKSGRGKFLRGLILWPWLLGSVLILVLSWPAPTFLSVLYPPLSSMVLGSAYGAAMNAAAPASVATSALLRWQWVAVAGLVLMGGLFRWLSQGVNL
jgi:hypothetical protein